MIVVIGASSFIGAYTVGALLNSGFEVLATGRGENCKEFFSSRGIPYAGLDLTRREDFAALPEENVEAVVLLAALLPANCPADLNRSENAEDYFAVNTIGTLRTLEYCRARRIGRLISTTTYAEVYGSWGRAAPITEEAPVGFPPDGDHTAYAVSKRAAADMMEYYNRQHGMRNVVFRLPPVYGAGPHGSLYINGTREKSGLQIFIEKARNGETIEVYGNGGVIRDVVYVKDVADAFVQVLRSESARGLYNISSGKGVSLRQQAETAARVFATGKGRSPVVDRPRIPNRSVSYVLDISKAKRDFGYSPRFADFTAMMKDYRLEAEKDAYGELFRSRTERS